MRSCHFDLQTQKEKVGPIELPSLFGSPYRSSTDDALYLYSQQPVGWLTASFAFAHKRNAVVQTASDR